MKASLIGDRIFLREDPFKTIKKDLGFEVYKGPSEVFSWYFVLDPGRGTVTQVLLLS